MLNGHHSLKQCMCEYNKRSHNYSGNLRISSSFSPNLKRVTDAANLLQMALWIQQAQKQEIKISNFVRDLGTTTANKQIKRVGTANQTRLFDRFYVCNCAALKKGRM